MATKKATTKATTKSKTTKACAKTCPAHAEKECAKIPYNYTPISMWGYFGYEFLFMIPVVGWILCIAFAFMAENHNLRNFARSQFCWLIISVVFFCILAGIGAVSTVFTALFR